GVCLIEGWFESVALRQTQIEQGHRTNRWYYDLRCERKGSDGDPGSQSAVIRAVGRPSGVIVIELPLYPVYASLLPTRPVGRCDSPAEFAVASELERVTNCIFLVDVGGLAAVLEIVGPVL